MKTPWLGGGLETSGLGSCFLARAFFVVRAFGFVLLVVLFVVRSSVRAFGRSFCGSFFWFVLLGARMCFFVRCFKILRGVCGKVRGFLMQR